ncbi:hypothetical protein SFR_0196 [Streptomyces sp. FR-008]|nr:hypothetical protein SFR_0196 [Streptomyces sp. FR-008]
MTHGPAGPAPSPALPGRRGSGPFAFRHARGGRARESRGFRITLDAYVTACMV